MAELLIELLVEDIPARMQVRALDDFQAQLAERLEHARLAPASLGGHVTPRRLVLVAEGVPDAQPDLSEERRGPRVGAPAAAVQGFLGTVGLASIEQLEQREAAKGSFYFAVIRQPGRPALEVLPELVTAAILALPWPKSMRWAGHALRFVRPLHGMVAIFDGRVLRGGIDLGDALAGRPASYALGPAEGVLSFGDRTRGHRFLAPDEFTVRSAADHREQLRAACVLLDRAERRARIAEQAAARARAAGLVLREDAALLEEVTGLVEWPVVLTGRIDPRFLEVPPEVLVTAMRAHQKYFALYDDTGRLAPSFLVVANLETADDGAAIVAGNERVLRARLSDARFFWDQDRRQPLASRVPALQTITFQARLGTVADKVARMERLAMICARWVPQAAPELTRRAAHLAKADLTTGMVGEFPELQGIMGRYYARHDGEDSAVADAIAEHYSPLGPGDQCPRAPVSVAVALADKLDSLVGFFAIGEKPTGSKDPFALRRAALGVIRLIVENQLRLPLRAAFAAALEGHALDLTDAHGTTLHAELLDFFADRLQVHLRERGVRHDLIRAVFVRADEDDLVRLLARVEALGAFLSAEDGANLLTAYRRASNILRIEEKKDGVSHADAPDSTRFAQDEERALHACITDVRTAAESALAAERFTDAMTALATLRTPVDAFFERVTVNAPDAALRQNRLRLLASIRAALSDVASFEEIQGD